MLPLRECTHKKYNENNKKIKYVKCVWEYTDKQARKHTHMHKQQTFMQTHKGPVHCPFLQTYQVYVQILNVIPFSFSSFILFIFSLAACNQFPWIDKWMAGGNK